LAGIDGVPWPALRIFSAGKYGNGRINEEVTMSFDESKLLVKFVIQTAVRRATRLTSIDDYLFCELPLVLISGQEIFNEHRGLAQFDRKK